MKTNFLKLPLLSGSLSISLSLYRRRRSRSRSRREWIRLGLRFNRSVPGFGGNEGRLRLRFRLGGRSGDGLFHQQSKAKQSEREIWNLLDIGFGWMQRNEGSHRPQVTVCVTSFLGILTYLYQYYHISYYHALRDAPQSNLLCSRYSVR